MSKKHFIQLADMMKDIRCILQNHPGEMISPGVAAEFFQAKLADFCADQNPRFNRQRWCKYIAGECGPNGGPVKAVKAVKVND